MANFFRYCFLGFFLVPSLVFGAVRTVVVQPSELQPTYTPGSGPYAFNDSRSWAEPVSVQPNSRVNVPVTKQNSYTWPKFRNSLKNALKVNPVQAMTSAAIAAAVAGVGWIMDEGTLVKKISDGEPISPDQYGWVATSGSWCGGQKFSSPSAGQACITAAVDAYLNSDWTVQGSSLVFLNSSAYMVEVTAKYSGNGNVNTFSGQINKQGTCPAPYVVIGDQCVTGQAQYAPLTDADLDSFTSSISDPNFAAGSAADILGSVPGSYDYPDGTSFTGPASIPGEPSTTTTTDASGTTVTTETPVYNFDYSTNPLSITSTTVTTTTVYNNGSLVSTSVSSNAGTVVDAPAEPQVEPPIDCEFMPTVCEWLDWTREPFNQPEPDFPVVTDDDYEETYTASFGGSCPPPRVVTTQFGALEISYEPLCLFASYIKYLVVGGAALMAAFIGLGIHRGKG